MGGMTEIPFTDIAFSISTCTPDVRLRSTVEKIHPLVHLYSELMFIRLCSSGHPRDAFVAPIDVLLEQLCHRGSEATGGHNRVGSPVVGGRQSGEHVAALTAL